MFSDLILQFSENLEVLRDFINLLNPVLDKKFNEFAKGHRASLSPLLLVALKLSPEILKKGASKEELYSIEEKVRSAFDGEIDITINEDQPIGTSSCSINISGAGEEDFNKAITGLEKTLKRHKILYTSSLISLISFVEWFLSMILHEYFGKFPEAAGFQERKITYRELANIESIGDARNYLIDEKVEEILRASFEDWLLFLKDNIKLSMGYINEYKNKLSEVFQRRNIVVHNGGIVNSLYLRKIPEEDRHGIKLGFPIHVNRKYLENSINLFEKCFILISTELWKKLDSKAEKRAEILNKISFEHLFAGRWEVAEGLSYFVYHDKGISERSQITGLINYWQCLKWQDRFEKIKKEVEDTDFSAKDEVFILIKFALLDDKDNFFKLLPHVLSTQKLTYEELKTWTIFKEMRKEQSFAEYCAEEQKKLPSL